MPFASAFVNVLSLIESAFMFKLFCKIINCFVMSKGGRFVDNLFKMKGNQQTLTSLPTSYFILSNK